MPEMVRVTMGPEGDDRFDELVHGSGSLSDGGDLELAVKRDGTQGGKPAVVASFTVRLPDGEIARVQTVTTLRVLLTATETLRLAYPEL